MKALLHGLLAGAALLFAFTPTVSARRFLFMESTYLGDGWFRYTASTTDDPYFLFFDLGGFYVFQTGGPVLELGPDPPRWTNNIASDGSLYWGFQDINGWNVQSRPYSASFQFRSPQSTFKRATVTLLFSLAIVEGWGEAGPIVSANAVGYWNADALVPCPPDEADGSGTNLLVSLPSELPDPVMAQLLHKGERMIGIAYDYPTLNTMRLEGSRDLKAWTNITYIFGDAGRTTWTSSGPLEDLGNFFRVSLVAEGHATVLPPLNPVAPGFVPACAASPAATAPAGVDSGVRLLSARPGIEGADLTLATAPGKSYVVTLLDHAMKPAWTVGTVASNSTTVVRIPTATLQFGILQIKEDSR
jgi:hypothetical protein